MVSVLLLGVVVAYAGLGQIIEQVRNADWLPFLGAVALMAVATGIGGVRWRLLLDAAEIEVSRLRAVGIFAAALFLNNVLPTSVGGDAVRTWVAGRQSRRLARATAATIVDKGTGVLCLFLVAWIALGVNAEEVPSSLIRVLLWTSLALVVVIAAVPALAAGARPVVRRFPQVLSAVRDARDAVRTWAGSGRLAGWLLLSGLVYQAIAVLALVLVARTVDVELSFALAAVCAAIVIVAMLVPISIGGLGVREAGFVALLAEAGIGAPEATAISLLSVAAILLATAAIVGAVGAHRLYSRRAWRRSPSRSPSPERHG